jgi:hypothetical protein
MSPYTTELIHLEDLQPRTGLAAKWQRARHRKAHWVSQCFAEAVRICYHQHWRLDLLTHDVA